VDQQQAHSSVLGGRVYPTFRNFPDSWVTAELSKQEGSAWSSGLWGFFGVAHAKVKPLYLLPLLLLGALYAFYSDKTTRSRRCISCGAIKCPRCHRLVKDAEVCGACWSLHHEGSKVDATSRQEMRGKIAHWAHETRTWRTVGSAMLPGWNEFFYSGGIDQLLIGIVWALCLAQVLSSWVVPFPALPRSGAAGFPVGFFAVLLLTHLGGYLSARRR